MNRKIEIYTHLISLVILCNFVTSIVLSQNIPYSNLYNNSTFVKTINVSLPVGSTQGISNVSNGSANYSIPIVLPQGTNNVTPTLSINYNSMASNGTLGLGWSFSGLSMISRATKNLYLDSKVEPVEISYNDRFILDGERLILKSGVYGYNLSTYGNEVENFSTTTAYGNLGNGPLYFKVETKDGVVMEFGNSVDSRFLNSTNSTALYWCLNKVIYKDGNYIEYKYQTLDAEMLISEINYTGNSSVGLLPYNKIKFNYLLRDDKNSTYEAGTLTRSWYLLASIVITTENNSAFKTYNFSYGNNNISSYLKEVQELGSNGVSLNSTIFKYGDDPVEFQTSSSENIQLQSGSQLFNGDFDSDGYSDILAGNWSYFKGIKYNTSFKVLKRTATNVNYSQTYSQTFPTSEYFKICDNKLNGTSSTFIPSDYDGDADDDILIVKLITTGNYWKTDRGDLYVSQGNGANYNINNINFPDPPTGSTEEHINPDGRSFNTGDFNGDGITDCLFMNIYNNNGWQFKVYISYGSNYPLNSWTEVTCPVTPMIPVKNWVEVADAIHIIDFNGDGKSDIMVIDESNTEIFTFETNLGSTVKKIYGSGFPTKWHLLYFGDFNGDRKTDILTRTSKTNNNAPWSKVLSTGNNWVEFNFSFAKIPDIEGNNADDKLIITDFNADGKQDIYHGWDDPIYNYQIAKLDFYYSKGDNFHNVRFDYNNVLVPFSNTVFDLNGDGRSDIVRNSNTAPTTNFYLKKEGKEQMLQKIKNGVDHDIEFAYKRITETNNFYIKGSQTAHPLNNIQTPVYFVSQFKSEDGIGGFSSIDYKYEELKVHKEGKGLLGMKKLVSIDANSGFTSIIENEFNNIYFSVLPLKISKYLSSSNALLNELTFTNAYIYIGNKVFWPRVNSTYENKTFEGQFISKSFSYDTYGNITSSINNVNNIETITSTFTYGQFGTPIPSKLTGLTESILRSGQSAYSKTTTYGYNNLGQMTSKTEFSGLPKSVLSSYTYNSLGNQTNMTLTPSGMSARTTSQVYDAKGRFIVSSINVLNQTTTMVNDIRWGKPTSIIGIDGLTTSFTYDAFGRLLNTNFPEGYTVSMSYNWDISSSEGTIYNIFTSHPGKPDIKIWYDILDREKRKESELLGSAWSILKITYDSRGNVKSTTMPYKLGELILTSTNTFDSYNRINSTSNTLGTTNYSYLYSGGNLTTTITNPASQVSTKIIDATNKMISATDYGGTLNYIYYSHGNIKEIKNGSIVLSSHEYDLYARQTKLFDINGGTTQYTTDALGQKTSEISATNQTKTYDYDLLSRITKHTRTEGNSTYTYFASGNGGSTNKLKSISSYGNISEEYTYDTYGRPTSKKETIDGVLHQTNFSYNTYGDLLSLTYPSNFVCNYSYDVNGYLLNIKNSNNVNLFTNTSTNGLNQTTAYSLGNGKSSAISYYFGIPTNYTTSGIQNLNLTWNYQSGNLTSRNDAIKNKSENFTYDNLNRLLSSSGNGLLTLNSSFLNNGNISTKTDAGTYSYNASKINALSYVSNDVNTISSIIQNLAYTSFYQPITISEGSNFLAYTYNDEDQRVKSVLKQNGTTVNTKYYFGDYETDQTSGTTRHLHYLSGPSGLFCIVERINGSDNYHYTYTDHLGSILSVTNSSGTIEAEQNFDPWGRKRNPSTWTYSSIPSDPVWLYRGFTGHEYIPQFALINMNGRLYDPIVGRMLSPDNNVQIPAYTQNLNRYSYALNNPLRFTDPDGEFLFALPTAFLLLTETGYDLQKHLLPFATHVDINLGTHKTGIGIDYSIGIPQIVPIGARVHGGISYNTKNLGDQKGFETRYGFELSTYSLVFGTTYYNSPGSKFDQRLGHFRLGGPLINFKYANDWFFDIPLGDGGDRYRTAAAKINFGIVNIGINLFTGDPGLGSNRIVNLNEGGKHGLYVEGANGEDPDEFRNGIGYIGIGPFRFGNDSENRRHLIQNLIIHDKISGSPYFKKLDRPNKWYFHFLGGGNLW